MVSWNDRDFDWRRIEALARKGFARVQKAADGDFGALGGNVRVGKMLASGDLRLVALYLIEQQPRHGYDLIKAVEEKSNGVYSPSPGIVYPALTYLEEAGYVTSEAEGNKKLYTITESGKGHLEDNRDAVSSTLELLARTGEQVNRFREFVRADWPFSGKGTAEDADGVAPHWPEADRPLDNVSPELEAARKALKQAIKKARHGTPEQQARAAEILRRAAAEVERLGEDDIDL